MVLAWLPLVFLLRWSSSIRGVLKNHIHALTEWSNALHQLLMIHNIGVTKIFKIALSWLWKNFKSLAQVWMCSNVETMLKALKWKLFKYGKIEDFKAQVINLVLYFALSIGMPYYQEGCNISLKTKSKVLLENLCEK